MKRFSWQRWLPFLNWPRLTPNLLRQDAMAGLTVALLLIPQSVAYAALAGMPLVTGLSAAVLPALVGALWGGSTRISVGPTALTCLLVSASLSGMAEPGSVMWVQLAIWLAVLSGLLQLALGAGGYGWLLNLISSPVMTGFTQAAALLIIGSQLPALLGLPLGLSGFFSGPLAGDLDTQALLYGVLSLVALLAAKRWAPRLPAIMLVVVGAGLLSHLTGFAERGGEVIGSLPAGLPTLALPAWPGLDELSQLLVPAMVLALVSFLETASSARTEHQQGGTRWNENQDLTGQGLAKLASALSGSFPTSASFSRSAIYLYAGARTGWAAIATAILVTMALLGAGALAPVPRAVLAAVVIMAVTGLLKPQAFVRLWQIGRVEAITAAVTFAITLLTAPRIHWGVLAGVLLTLGHFLHTRLHPRIIEVGLHPDGSLRDRHLWKLPPLAERLYALRMDAELDFAAASGLERAIGEHLAQHPEVRHVCLFAQPINRIDVTGVETFGQLQRQLMAKGITLHISGIKLPVESTLRQAGELQDSPLLRLYRTDAEALQALTKLGAPTNAPNAPGAARV
ncbi:MAG: SulP family inorganic anion transporter [Limnohabitans sp.]